MTAELLDWPAAGFPGTAVNPRTLAPEVVDDATADAAVAASGDPADAVFVLLARGRTKEAAEAAAQARLGDPESLRLQVLDADILRANRRLDQAEAVLKSLLPAAADTPVGPLVQHELGRVYFSAAQYAAAAQAFAGALETLVASGSDPQNIYAATVSLRRARDLAEA
ncbi:tetratricopeptide repeat protein [Specibacter cremeus]|uniref:tetratricopeptide repeat protein n=1 Tax=Specibacter cremeus TaxID=1629051 RepID=UPI000F7686A9|nr:tetratricopeptide repeat protein [Specibacter cremeus]